MKAANSNFNRGQTISGLKKENSQRLENRRLIVRRRKIGSFLAALVFSSVIIVFVLIQIVINFEFTDQSGRKINNPESLKKSISRYYDSQPTERLKFFLDKDSLLTEIQKDNPEVLDIIDIKMNSLTNYNFKLSMRRPVALWEMNGQNLYVDEKGIAFSKNYYQKPDLIVSDESGIPAKTGKVIAGSNFMGFIGRIIASANKNNLKITHIKIPPATLRQVEIKVEGINYPIKMLTTASPEGQVANLLKSINFFSQKKQTIQYLDLRVEGKAFYK